MVSCELRANGTAILTENGESVVGISDPKTQHIKIPEGTKRICQSTFLGSEVVEVELPLSLEIIEMFAFKDCKYLKSVNIGENINYIGSCAFEGCTSLEGEIVIPTRVTEIMKRTFSNCQSLSSIIISEGVTAIDDYAFSYCSNISNRVTIPNGVRTIGYGAFASCLRMQSIDIPESVESIGKYCFFGCSSLSGDFIIPPRVTVIGEGTFCQCNSLRSVKIHSGVSSIEESAFSYSILQPQNRICANIEISAETARRCNFDTSLEAQAKLYSF